MLRIFDKQGRGGPNCKFGTKKWTVCDSAQNGDKVKKELDVERQ